MAPSFFDGTKQKSGGEAIGPSPASLFFTAQLAARKEHIWCYEITVNRTKA
jgi:hypothetical protein